MTKSHNICATLLVAALGLAFSPVAQCSDFETAAPGTLVGAAGGVPALPPRTADQLGNFSKKKEPTAADLARLKVYNLLQTTRELVDAKKYQDALVKLQEVESVPNKTPEETYVAERTRIAIASGLGDDKMLAQSLEPVIANDRLPAEDRTKFVQALAILYYQQKDFPNAIKWTSRDLKEGGANPEMQARLAYRLMFKTDQLSTADDFTGMAKLALQGGYPTEALQVLSQGFKKGVLGSGAGASEQKQLLALATQRSASKPKTLAKEEAALLKAKDGDGLVQIGYVYVTDGQFDKGVSLMEQGIHIGGMKHPEHAKLHLGIAKALAGHNSDAIQILKSVKGTDGAAELAKYWTIQLAHPNV